MRIEVIARPSCPDGRALRLARSLARAFPPGVQAIAIVDVYLLDGVPDLPRAELSAIFSDPVAQDAFFDEPAAVSRSVAAPGWDLLVEVTARPGVTDPVALTAREALGHSLGAPLQHGAVVQTAVQFLIAGWGSPDASRLAGFFHNPLVQAAGVITRAEWGAGKRPAALYPHRVPESRLDVETFDLAVMDDARLVELSRGRLLALSLDEMKTVQAWAAGRGGPVTDVELEMIAQTWSEHCKHKIFNATIHHREAGREETIRSLFKTYIRSTTERLAGRRRFLRSVFHDNSGVVAFDRRALVCFKVETHNSPSALDPYGGAITGIVGVNRDIMGTGKGARPIFNTNVLCFGWPDTPETEVPAGLLHPRRVMEGVHRGIVDGGNQSGIPVVAGGFVFDESYLGKPLVFCGTGGILPARVRGRPSWERAVEPGDLAVMVGGRIGKDGIHGATFSSEALSSSSPTSAVQIGDPITQKKACDLLLEARDLGLYRGLTDNGAGGLSSSLGEMATLSGGVRIDLDRCPLKYAGLAPWEVLLSESQERMSLAVPKDRLEAFLALAKRRDVEATAVGEFTTDGFVEVTSGGRRVARVDLAFLHEGLPTMELRSEWIEPERREAGRSAAGAAGEAASPPDLAAMLRAVLSDPNIRSREEWVRQYDHEVQARSVVKPFVGVRRDAPSDGAVLRLRPDARIGITVTHGIAPRYGDWDAYDMARCAVDEAVRGHVALGGDPDRMAGLDNFCWPDPVEGPENPDGAYKLAQLVRACRGLADACTAYGLPLISGKDSMKNDARVGGRRISVRPTLLVSLLGVVPDVRRSLTTDFKRPGDQVWLVGTSRGELGGTVYERISGQRLGACPSLDATESLRLYRRVHRAARRGLVASCHDLSDGGLWAALAESALGGGLGAEVSLDSVPAGRPLSAEQLLFGETPGRLLVTVGPRSERRFRRMMRGLAVARIGVVAAGEKVRMTRGGAEVGSMTVDGIRAAWKNVGAAREEVPGEPCP
ncbi:MAG: AIR synthase-related protein [Spirochaetes bacterium]|nr:AIR synthase-related protein [Spirochaetota bacterium]